jgi:dTDP-3-amino-3,4,6-trideoxy-alpha-D-glucose transaminase
MATVARQNSPVAMTRLDDSDPALMQELLETVSRVARSAGFTLGPEVLAFEAEFALYCGTGHAIGVSSGTDALALTLRALRIGPGDEVLVPANTFIGTAEAVSMAGAVPRFVDVDTNTGLVTADGIREALVPRTRGVIPVHLYGRTLDLEPIVELAHDHGVAVVEDACQAHGAWVGSRRAGAIGDAGCFSFYPAKNLGASHDPQAQTGRARRGRARVEQRTPRSLE